MGNLGAGELLLLLILGLLVFGPDRLPEIARNLGKAIRTFQEESQKAAGTLRQALEDESPPPRPANAPVVNVPATASDTPASDAASDAEPAPAPVDRRYEDT
jgi:TatA/E family protein of Tat protein translocase